jgi:hypothetical protein
MNLFVTARPGARNRLPFLLRSSFGALAAVGGMRVEFLSTTRTRRFFSAERIAAGPGPGSGAHHRRANGPGDRDPDMNMLVKLGDRKDGRSRPSWIGFLVVTIGPWLVLIWLLWPRR